MSKIEYEIKILKGQHVLEQIYEEEDSSRAREEI